MKFRLFKNHFLSSIAGKTSDDRVVKNENGEKRMADIRWINDGTQDPSKRGEVDKNLVVDVINIFRDITGVPLDRESEQAVIRYWSAKGWSRYDFRLMIQHRFHNERDQEFLGQPGNMNLRMMLNPSISEKLIDVMRDLRWKADNDKKKLEASKSSLPPKMVMRCGEKILVGDKEGVERHNRLCFDRRGACFFPQERVS